MSDYVALYESYLLKVKNASANTVSSYIRDLRQFDKYVSEQLNCGLDQVEPDQMAGYFAWMTNAGKSSARRARCASVSCVGRREGSIFVINRLSTVTVSSKKVISRYVFGEAIRAPVWIS